MKLLTYDTGTGPRCGVLQDDQVLDVTVLAHQEHLDFTPRGSGKETLHGSSHCANV